jgi:hypothetical protein
MILEHEVYYIDQVDTPVIKVDTPGGEKSVYFFHKVNPSRLVLVLEGQSASRSLLKKPEQVRENKFDQNQTDKIWEYAL